MKSTTGSKLTLSLLLLLSTLQLQAAEEWMNMSGSFTDWNQIGDANWHITDGEFVADSGNGHLVTRQSFSDVRIKAEFWASEGANSGIFLRASDPASIADANAYEVNIFDNRADQTYRTGGLVNFAAPMVSINTPGKWNTYDITLQGDHIVVILNGETTIDTHDATYASGPISLQYGAGVVKFRNMQIQKL